MPESLHHAVLVFLLDFDEREALHQVDATDGHLVALHVLVYHADNLAGIHAVYLADIQEEADVAFLRLMLLAPCSLPLAPCSLSLAPCPLLLGVLYLRRIGVILEETPELTREHAADEVVLVEPCPALLHLFHEGRNLFFVHLYALYLVDDMIELLGADVARLGQGALLEGLLYLLLHLLYLRAFAHADDADARALLACAPRASGAVRVVLHVIRHAVVDDVCQVVHVQTACRHVGCHEELYAVAAEALHRQVALLLREVAVQGVGVVAVADEVVRHLLRLKSSAAEDDGVDAGVEVDDALQGMIPVAHVYHIIYVVHVLGPFVSAAHLYLCGIGQVVLCDAFNLAAHRRAEEQRAVLAGDASQNAVQVLLEAHRQHLVCLVEHDVLHAGEVGYAALHEVHQPAGCCHDDVGAGLEGAYLRLDVRAAVDGQNAHLGHVFAEALQVVRYLQAQFARWA